jgi:DNA-binding NarL/FixJ family response regulator
VSKYFTSGTQPGRSEIGYSGRGDASVYGGEGRRNRLPHPPACFQKLKPRERALLWLAYVEGYAHNEIAGTLDLNEKSIKVLLFRARRNLERILRQNGLSEVQP